MLKFFRRIRQKLINQGDLKRYLIYAIGEVILVMIGILLALQVNNWNLKKIDTTNKEKLLVWIKNELQVNIVRTMVLSVYEKRMSFNDRQLKILMDGIVFDSIDIFLVHSPFKLTILIWIPQLIRRHKVLELCMDWIQIV